MRIVFVGFLSLLVLAGGVSRAQDPVFAPEVSARPVARAGLEFATRWDHIPASRTWNRAALAALRSHARVLPEIVPKDILTWCPAYPAADRLNREAFWVGLLSTLSKHESTYRPTAVGGGGLWYGLVQILPATARGYKCRARSGDALKNGGANMSCALRIMSTTVRRDQVVSAGMRGVAADWGPFHSRRKRQDMIGWLRSQKYCKAVLTKSLRPRARANVAVVRALDDPGSVLPPGQSEGRGTGVSP